MTELEKIQMEEVVRDTIHTELGEYKVPKKQHYKDHLFLEDLRYWHGQVRSSFIKTIIGVIAVGLITLILLGVKAWR